MLVNSNIFGCSNVFNQSKRFSWAKRKFMMEFFIGSRAGHLQQDGMTENNMKGSKELLHGSFSVPIDQKSILLSTVLSS